METKQPVWRVIANLGDASPLEYGGAVLLVDETGVYDPELVVLDLPAENLRVYEVYRFSVERLYKVEHEDHIYYVTRTIKEGFDDGTLPYHIGMYKEWFLDFAIDGPDPLLGMLLSEDPIDNAMAYLSIAGHYGIDNFDSYPLHMGRRELIEWTGRHLPGADLNDKERYLT